MSMARAAGGTAGGLGTPRIPCARCNRCADPARARGKSFARSPARVTRTSGFHLAEHDVMRKTSFALTALFVVFAAVGTARAQDAASDAQIDLVDPFAGRWSWDPLAEALRLELLRPFPTRSDFLFGSIIDPFARRAFWIDLDDPWATPER
jgi:hypothetical protein